MQRWQVIVTVAVFLAMPGVAGTQAQEKQEKRDKNGTYTETRQWCGEPVQTPNLHNVRSSEPGCHRLGDGKWCFKPSFPTIKLESDKWMFFGEPARVECTRNNQESCQWNVLGAEDRTTTITYNPNKIEYRILTGSRSIGVRICANARYYP